MAREAAYWMEFRREALEKELAREIPEHDVIEALDKIKILVNWKRRCQVIDDGQVIKEWWVDGWRLVVYQPGQVLYRKRRLVSDWELEEWKSLPEEKLKGLGILRKGGAFSVEIVEKVIDLPAAIRQLGRHIPAEKIARPRKKFVLDGDAQILTTYAEQLSELLQELLRSPKSSAQLMERASPGIEQLSLLLDRGRTSFKRKASGEIRLAQQGKLWEIPVQTSQIITDLLKQRAEDYEIAVKSIESAGKLLDLMVKIERRFHNGYIRLGVLGEKLQGLLASGKKILPEDLLSIARGAMGVYQYLTKNIPNFNPYYQRLQAPEFQRLARVVTHSEEGEAGKVFNDIKEATAKLEAVAIGERVTRTELQEAKEQLLKG